MKFRNYLDTISDIGIYPMVSLLIFFIFFVCLLWYVFTLNKKETAEIANSPLEDGTIKKGVLTFAMILFGATLQAQDKKPYTAGNEELYVSLAIIAGIFGLLILGSICILTISIVQKIALKSNPDAAAKIMFSKQWWRRFRGINTELGEEDSILIKDHEYDGIQELDNRMPPWLKFLFQTTICIAIIYLSIYHGFKIGDLPQAELEKSLKLAEVQKAAYIEKQGALIDEKSVTFLSDEAAIEEGKGIYVANCAACHGAAGEGTVGPNLTDDHWLHGGGVKNIFKTIKYGIPEKGMIAWEKLLKPQEIQKVSSYIISIHNSNPVNPKEPQGELWSEEVAAN